MFTDRSSLLASRTGTALVLALILLVALMLLGLPFLFSQSSSVVGTRSFADARLVTITRENAEHLATAVVANALVPLASTPPPTQVTGWQAWSNLPASLAASTSVSIASPPDTNGGLVALAPSFCTSLGLNTDSTSGALPGGVNTSIGATITDVCGCLDPNTLSAAAWQALLAAVGITDWNDQQVYPPAGSAPPGGYPATTYVPSSDHLGQLAKAMAAIRGHLPGGRITDLAQLLTANPQTPLGQPGPGPYRRLRWPLTRVELERLRPYLTLLHPGPGRAGAIDVGTVIATDPASSRLWLDSSPDPLQPLVAVGTHLTGPLIGSTAAQALAQVTALPGLQTLTGPSIGGIPVLPILGSATWANQGDAIALETPAALNIHQLAPAVRAVYSPTALPVPITNGLRGVVPTETGLWAVVGRTAATATTSTFNCSAWISPISTGVELPPLGIRSDGIVLIDSSAALTNPLHQLLGVEHASTVVQAVPQEYLQEHRWLTQGDLQGLVAARWVSHLQTWPVAVERLTDVVPDDHDFNAGQTLADIPPSTGLRPRPLPSAALVYVAGDLAINPATALMPELQWPLEQEPMDWRVGFGMGWPVASSRIYDAETFVGGQRSRSPALNPASLPTTLTTIRPDGCYHAPATTLAYSLTSTFPLSGSVSSGTSALLLPRDATLEMGARQFGLWVKPESAWASGLHPLLTVRMPASNVGQLASGASGSTDSENLLQLVVDGDHGLLVLAIAPPSVESLGDTGGSMDAIDPGDVTLDHQCLADAPDAPVAPDPYADHAASLLGFTGAFARNRVLHCFATPANGGRPYFQAGQWYHIQVDLASDRPDGVTLVVDGLVGQDAAHMAGGPQLSHPGDHFTLPGLVLEQVLPSGPITQASQLELAAIAVAVPAPLTARSVLPQQGVVRIDDEYIHYDGISADGGSLLNCLRGYRQETVASSSNPAQCYPSIQGHAVGALVAPGGYHLALATSTPPGSQLYRGGCTLAQPVGVGDPSFATAPGVVWVGMAGAPGTGGLLAQGTTSLPVNPMTGVWAQFPACGIIQLNGVAMAYGAKGPASLNQLTPLQGGAWTVVPGGAIPTQGIHATGLAYKAGDPVVLLSMQLASANPLDPGRYKLTPGGTGGAFLVALQDATGQVEWTGYDAVISDGVAFAYLVSKTGFPTSQRAQCRTPLLSHAAGALVLPVQTELGNAGHWLATGDTITLLPHAPAAGNSAGVPVQLIVRTAATDGFPTTPGGSCYDNPNWYVAFAEPIPDAAVDPPPNTGVGLLCAQWDVVCGTCWSAWDLTAAINPLFGWQRSLQPRGCLPRLDRWSPGAGVNGITAQVFIAGDDPAAPTPLSSDCTIDDLTAGGLTHSGPGLDGHESSGNPDNLVTNGVSMFWINGQPQWQLAAEASLSGVLVQTTTPMFAWTSCPSMGLVTIDGEVFAYAQPAASDAAAILAGIPSLLTLFPNLPNLNAQQIISGGSFARLIGRGLLSDTPGGIAHVIGTGSVTGGPFLQDWLPHTPLLSAIRLPMGPVRQLDGTFGTGTWCGFLTGTAPASGGSASWTRLGAPVALVSAADGSRHELMQVIGPAGTTTSATTVASMGYTTAPWLRGLYNTGVSMAADGSDWSGTASAPRPIVIGWWPRYPSALAGGSPSAAALRSRSTAWASYPVTVFGAYCDPSRRARLPAPFSSMPMVSVAVTPDPLFQVLVRAAGGMGNGTFSWAGQLPALVPGDGSDPTDATGCYQPDHDGGQTLSNDGKAVPTDGIEVRVDWQYTGATSQTFEDMAAAGNRAPTIDAVRVRYLAPVRVLSGSSQ